MGTINTAILSMTESITVSIETANEAKMFVIFVMLAIYVGGCGKSAANAPHTEPIRVAAADSLELVTDEPKEALRTAVSDTGLLIVTAARAQIGKTVVYDPTYTRITYPMGDVDIEVGVCTDVVIRALRSALKMDLQRLVHEDMAAAFSEYPKQWGLKGPDRNIDHRRVLNLGKYFDRKGWALTVTKNPHDYLPGDIVTCTLPGNLPHIMVVSDKKTTDGIPLVIHNIGGGAKEEGYLFTFPLTGHYRVKRV